MDHPCSKEEVLGQLTATVRFFQEAERRREGREERMAVAMETMSAQGESLKGLSKRVEKTEHDTDNLYDRVRELEIAPGKEAGTVKVGCWTALITAAITLIFSLFVKKG